MPSQVVGKHVRALEDHLGVKLINRTTRRQSVTDLGRDFYDSRVRTILAEVEAAEALAAETRVVPRGRLRVNAPVTFGAYELARVLPDYLATYPDVALDLTLADRTVDLIDEGYDVVFRTGPLADSGLIAKPLRSMSFILCAAPAYVAARGAPRTPLDVREHECLGFAYGTTRDRWSFSDRRGTVDVEVSCRLVGNTGQALLTSALAGLGLLFATGSAGARCDRGRQARSASGRIRHPQPTDAYPLCSRSADHAEAALVHRLRGRALRPDVSARCDRTLIVEPRQQKSCHRSTGPFRRADRTGAPLRQVRKRRTAIPAKLA